MSAIKSPQIMSPHCNSAFVTVEPLQFLLTGEPKHLFSKGREERHVHLHVYLLQNVMYVTKHGFILSLTAIIRAPNTINPTSTNAATKAFVKNWRALLDTSNICVGQGKHIRCLRYIVALVVNVYCSTVKAT